MDGTVKVVPLSVCLSVSLDITRSVMVMEEERQHKESRKIKTYVVVSVAVSSHVICVIWRSNYRALRCQASGIPGSAFRYIKKTQ